LSRIRALEPGVIVHLPRSGTIVGALLSTHLYLPLCSVTEWRHDLIHTRKATTDLLHKPLLVDDSIHTGVQMAEAIAWVREELPDFNPRTFAVFRTKPEPPHRLVMEADLTLCDEGNVSGYVYPWFMWKTRHSMRWCFDMDGVLCDDCPKGADDDGERYLEFLRQVLPKHRSLHGVGTIVTSRLEKYRPETEAWLHTHGVRYQELVMGPWATLAERHADDVAQWKATEYMKRPAARLFVESHDRTAQVIARLSGKRVWCVDEQRWY
jgi:uncharacterized HAD superfamily protein